MEQSRREFLKGTAITLTAALAIPREQVSQILGVSTSRTSRSDKRGASITLVQDGRSTYGIVVLPGAAQAAQHGAQELQSHIQAMSGAMLPLLSSADVAKGILPPGVKPGHVITIGPPSADRPLAEEAFAIQTVGPTIAITGGGLRGAMYGCYALLDDVMGVRWFTSDCTRIPKQSTIVLPNLNLHDQPAFSYRDPYWTEAFQHDWAARNRCNGTASALDASVGGRVHYGLLVHTFYTLVSPAQYFTTHPEYFSLVNGQRVQDSGLCLSNPAVATAAAASLRHLIPTAPDAVLWSVSQLDKTDSYCRCGPCQAIAEQEGSQAGPLLRFINAIAQNIEPDFPHVLIDTLAYQWSKEAPRLTRPRANVRIRYAISGSCLAHGLDVCPKNATVYRQLQAWCKLTNQMYVWDYGVNFANYLQPFPNLGEIGHNMPLFHKLGVNGVFYEGDSSTGGGGACAELRSYVLAKLMWNPARDSKALIAEFIGGVYGAGAPFIQQWIDAQQAEVAHVTGPNAVHITSADPPTVPYLPDALLNAGTTLFNAAERATAGDPSSLNAVQKARLSLEYMQMVRSKAGSAERVQLANTVVQKTDQYHIRFISEGRVMPSLQTLLR